MGIDTIIREMSRNPMDRVAPFGLLIPVMAVLPAVSMLGATPTVQPVIRGLLTTARVTVIRCTLIPESSPL